jgi:SAM-dependent MidA family methyltransferase
MGIENTTKNIIKTSAVSKTELNNSKKYMTIEKHTFLKNSQINNIQKYHKCDFIKFIDCNFKNIDFGTFGMVANEFINCKFEESGFDLAFYNNNFFEDSCLFGGEE